MISPNQPDDIRRQMVAMRSLLQQDARSLAADASRMADWRYHFRAHPLLWCGGAAVLGYLAVPRRLRGQSLAAPAITAAAASGTPSVAAGPSVSSVLLTIAANVLTRGAAAYVQRAIERLPTATATHDRAARSAEAENFP